MNHALVVNRLIHPDQLFERQPIRTFGTESQRRIHILEHVVHLCVVNPAPDNKIQMFRLPKNLELET